MDEQTRFRTSLAVLQALAAKQEGMLTLEEVKEAFPDMDLDDSQMQMICAYLAEKRIRVEGAAIPPAEDMPYTDEEQEFLKQYKKELRRLEKQPGECLGALYDRAADGDAAAKKILTEHYMDHVLRIAGEYAHGSLPIQDLIQEGSLGLMIGLDTLGLMEEGTTEEEYLEHEIRRALQEALREQDDARDMGEEITEKLNRLADSVRELTEDLGREATPDEISLYLDMPLEEIEDLLRIAGETIETAEPPEN